MAVTVQQLARAARQVADRGRVVRLVADELDAVIPGLEDGIRARALSILPSGGGLNVWVAGLRLRSTVRLFGRRVRATIVGHRRSIGGASDIDAIDRGRVRHPSWGRRSPGDWHVQTVTPGFFSRSEDAPVWAAAAQRGLNRAWAEVTR